MNCIQFSLAVTLLWQFITIEKISTLSVLEMSKFPNVENSPFHLQILPDSGEIKMNILPTETMVITIRDKNHLLLEKHIFNYGIQYSIDEEFIGNFINIPKWQRDINTSIIDITILFKKNSNSNFIEIFHLPATSIESRKKMLKNLKLSNRIYSSKINLLIPSKLELFVISINQSNEDLLFPNEIAIAICRAYDGEPKVKPIFKNHESFNVTNSEYNIERNERKLWFNVSLTDHLKNLTCNVLNNFKSTTIFVLHSPSQIHINPEIGETIQPNQTIICFTKDGYPKPFLSWNFISGPSNSSLFYEINQTKLHIKTNSPVESIWKFYCSPTNKTQNVFNKTISFTIRKKANQKQKNELDFENNFRKIKSMEKFIKDQVKSIKDMINKLDHDHKRLNEIKNIEINNISKIVNILNHNQSVFANITNNKINLFNNSIDKMRMENELFKQNSNKKIDVLMKNNSQLFQSLIDKNDKLNRSIQSIIKNMTIQAGNVEYQMTTIRSDENKQNSNSQFDWVVDDFSPKHLKINFFSFYNIKFDETHNFKMDLWYWFYRNELRIYFYIKNLTLTNQLNSTVQIINKNNEQKYIKMTKGFTVSKIKDYRSPNFIFNYDDLLKSEVLKGNSIIIRCYLTWIK